MNKILHLNRKNRCIIYLSCLLLANFFSACELSYHSAPEDNRFTTTVLTQAGLLNEPMAFSFVSDEEVLIVERKGDVKSLNVTSREVETIGHVPVNIMYTNKEGRSRAAEEGLMGIIAHPDFQENNWVFMLYADPEEPKHVLARWEYVNGELVDASKTVVLEYPTQREECCHTGGGMVFDRAGNLFITTGNNTINPPQGTSNLDERPGYKLSDDQRTSSNTNDLRGKILRIHPEDDGTYSIPVGNLFAKGTEKTRPEIYTMGHRNPWRVSIDNETGYIYWGEVGPDATEDTDQGPRGYDEFNQAKGPGFFGWPYFIGDNFAYADYDYETDSIYGHFDANKPVNTSPNNTGITELPVPQKAFFWYPYGHSEEFPLLGSAGRSATGGPVFRQSDFPESVHRFPAYYEGKLFITEFMRGWIMVVSMDENGDYVSMEQFAPNENFSSAIDMLFSPTGDLYVLEYGSAWFRGNENAQVKRIQYNGGNRMPIVKARANKMAGAVPLDLQLSSEGTIDYDEDKLNYEWIITSPNGYEKRFSTASPKVTLEDIGVYTINLVVEDDFGNSNQQAFEVIAGNEPPVVDIHISEGNQSFFFPDKSLTYEISVNDAEDGDFSKGNISADAIAINFDYLPEGFDPIEIAQNHVATDDWTSFSRGKSLIDGSDCFSCHRINEKSIGPSYMEVAKTYQFDAIGQAKIADHIINGSVGMWGEHAMSAHPDVSLSEADLMVDYIMTLIEPQKKNIDFPVAGKVKMIVPDRENGKGGYLLRAAYADKGANQLKSLSAEKIIALRNPVINPEHYDHADGTQLLTTPSRSFNIVKDGAYLGFNQLDLTGIDEIVISAETSNRVGAAGGVIELYLDSPSGELLGVTEKIVPIDIDLRGELMKLRKEWEDGGEKGPRPGFNTVREMFQKKYPIAVDQYNEHRDIYLVFKNPDAKLGQILVEMKAIEFVASSNLVQ